LFVIVGKTMPKFVSASIRLSAIATLPAVCLTLLLPMHPAAANDFEHCVSDLIETGLAGSLAGTACSDALEPEDLSECVSDIRADTPIKPENALDACYQVRRPIDLASCVVDIHADALETQSEAPQSQTSNQTKAMTVGQTQSPPVEREANLSLVALDSCRRSLLPDRYSECVVGLYDTVPKITPLNAMNTCLSAEDFPRDLFPAYQEN
jgi:hypothetical protein